MQRRVRMKEIELSMVSVPTGVPTEQTTWYPNKLLRLVYIQLKSPMAQLLRITYNTHNTHVQNAQ